MKSALLVYNEPVLAEDHPDAISEAGVLDAVNAVERSLRQLGLSVDRFPVGGSIRDLSSRLSARRAPDLAFNLCEGLGGAGNGEAQVAGLIELLDWPLTGNSSQCLALVRDKPRTKWLLRGAGLPTADFLVIRQGQPFERAALESLLVDGRLIVKPAAEDASLGIDRDSVVDDLPSLERQIADVASRYGDVLIERFIDGREFNIGVIALKTLECLPIAEIVFEDQDAGLRMVTYDAKWSVESDDYLRTPVECPAKIDDTLAAKLRDVALRAFVVCGCRSYARVDLRLSPAGEPFILEVNANPDISPSAGLTRALNLAGIDYTTFVERVVEEAVLRAEKGRGANAQDERLPTIARRHSDDGQLRGLTECDIPGLVEILQRCNVFRPDEIAVGREVLEAAAKQGSDGNYRVVVAERSGETVGWACYGLVPLTDATYDLYWIAVDPRVQSAGVGRCLVEKIWQALSAVDGRWLLAETSAAEAYENTRQFYLRTGFELLSSIPDFYRAGDGRAIFGLRIDAASSLK